MQQIADQARNDMRMPTVRMDYNPHRRDKAMPCLIIILYFYHGI